MHTETISIHRLPTFYRYSLTLLWIAIPALLIGAVLLSRGVQLALFDPRLLILLLIMLLPAMHIWQQGVDVRGDGLLVRLYAPRFHQYEKLHSWQLESFPQGKVLSIVDIDEAYILRFHAAHLSDLPILLAALKHHLDTESRQNLHAATLF